MVVNASDLSGVSRTSFGSDTDITSFDWVNNERILMSPGRAFLGQLDFKQPTGEIFGIDANGKNFEILFGFQAGQLKQGRIKGREAIQAAGRIVDLLPDDPDHIIVQSIGYGLEGEINEAWEMDVNTGRLRKAVKSPIRNGRFTTDANHDVKYVSGVNNSNVNELYQRIGNKWELMFTDEDKERWVTTVAPYGTDGKMLVSDQNSAGIRGFSIWDPGTGNKVDMFHHDVVDANIIFYDNNHNIWAIQYNDHFPAYFYPDETHPFASLHRRLINSFKDYNVQIIDETDARDKVIVYVSSPQYPGDFLLMDTQALTFPMRLPSYPNLPVEILSRMDPVEFTVRDGETIRGYLTMPINQPGKNLPMVVVPHGGPHGIADVWAYNYEVQMLASRGYAVLQINFRGSGGRGVPFEKSGYGEWGGKMQDDITDAVLWAIRDGVADPERICIFGSSYGGYAALTGAYQTPELYKCAVGLSGVYDLNLLFTEGDIADAERGLSFLKEVLGEDKALLNQRSPVANAEKITANVMLIHGKQDQRAPLEHAERMRAALEKQGKQVVWVTEKGETHGIMSEANRLHVYEELLSFLNDNIGQ